MVDLYDLQCAMNKSVVKVNQVTLEKFVMFLSQKGIHVDNTTLNEFQQQLPRSYFQLTNSSSRKKDTKSQRTPNSYNMFIRDKMREIKLLQPTLTGKELLRHATQEWNKYKQQKNNVPLTQDKEDV